MTSPSNEPIVELDYSGKLESVNRRYVKGHVTSPSYRLSISTMAAAFFAQYTGGEPKTPLDFKVDVVIHASISKRRDSDNFIKPLLDALERARVLENDRLVDDLAVIRTAKPKGALDVAVVRIYHGGFISSKLM